VTDQSVARAERLRLFVATTIPHELLAEVRQRVAPIRPEFPGARWTDPEHQHVTLKFLGWVDAPALDAIRESCARVAAGHAPGRLALTSLDAFPSKKRVRVLWIGIDDPADLLSSLARALGDELGAHGYEPEARAFTPHLTLARLKTPLRFSGPWPDVAFDTAPWTCGTVTLFRSHLSPKGARYEVVDDYELGG
jgi:2'-5' RNA ligase